MFRTKYSSFSYRWTSVKGTSFVSKNRYSDEESCNKALKYALYQARYTLKYKKDGSANERHKRYYAKNRKKILSKRHKYYRANLEKKRQYSREYYHAHKDHLSNYWSKYYRKNKDAILKQQREYYRKNKDTILRRQKENRHKNKVRPSRLTRLRSKVNVVIDFLRQLF